MKLSKSSKDFFLYKCSSLNFVKRQFLIFFFINFYFNVNHAFERSAPLSEDYLLFFYLGRNTESQTNSISSSQFAYRIKSMILF